MITIYGRGWVFAMRRAYDRAIEDYGRALAAKISKPLGSDK